MSTALSNNSHRNLGEIKTVTMKIPPKCPACKKQMGICKRKNVRLVGLAESYTVSIPSYGCRKKSCPERMKHLITPPNPYAAPRMTYDYDVQAEVSLIRWQEKATYEEISDRMNDRFEISIKLHAIETILKSYEIASMKTYRTEKIDQIKQHGGIFICVDVMEPLKGRKGFLVAYDYWTGLTLGSKKLPNGKQSTYEKFLRNLKERVKNELDLPIIGIISDALPTQRKAIAAEFPDTPHCLCHYHFYNYVLKNAKSEDSGIVTQIRKALRLNYDINQFRLRVSGNSLTRSQYEVLEPLFKPLEELSHWNRKPRDPCFTGLELWGRLNDLTQRFHLLEDKVRGGLIKIPKHSIKVVNRILLKLNAILDEHKEIIHQLKEIHTYLGDIVEVLSSTETNETYGMKQMLHLVDRLNYEISDSTKGSIIIGFISELKKYIESKGQLIFNYRKIPDAPNTNNFQELKFKQLKHFLRRVIGHSAAKEFLMAHGERIMFVNPHEGRENIRKILKTCDQVSARREIEGKRRSMDSWVIVMHNKTRWDENMKKLDIYINGLEEKPKTIS